MTRKPVVAPVAVPAGAVMDWQAQRIMHTQEELRTIDVISDPSGSDATLEGSLIVNAAHDS